MAIDTHVLAYLAGMIDGDGYVSITQSRHKKWLYFGPQIGIAGTRREPHDIAASIWGGKVSCYAPKNKSHRPQFQWSRVGAVAAKAIEAICPYLVIKRPHAELALELWEHVQLGRSRDPYPWLGPNYGPTEASRQMRIEMISLNQSRNKCREWSEFPIVETAVSA